MVMFEKSILNPDVQVDDLRVFRGDDSDEDTNAILENGKIVMYMDNLNILQKNAFIEDIQKRLGREDIDVQVEFCKCLEVTVWMKKREKGVPPTPENKKSKRQKKKK